MVSLSRFPQGAAITLGEGVLFVTYGTLRTGAKQGKKSRVEHIVQWAGRDFDGVIAFDEAHALANATSVKGDFGLKATSQQARAGLKLTRFGGCQSGVRFGNWSHRSFQSRLCRTARAMGNRHRL